MLSLLGGGAAARAADLGSTTLGSSTVTCVAGCRPPSPHVVQHIEHVVSAGPKAKTQVSEVSEVMLGIWCGKRGHCIAAPVNAPSSTTITWTLHEVTIWSR